MKYYSFEKLDVWQDSRKLVRYIYKITDEYPRNEIFGLVNQMKRSSVSVSSNIAEGSTRISNKDQAHFSQISFSSLMELLNQLILSKDLNFINDNTYSKVRKQIDKIAAKLSSLRRYQLNR